MKELHPNNKMLTRGLLTQQRVSAYISNQESLVYTTNGNFRRARKRLEVKQNLEYFKFTKFFSSVYIYLKKNMYVYKNEINI